MYHLKSLKSSGPLQYTTLSAKIQPPIFSHILCMGLGNLIMKIFHTLLYKTSILGRSAAALCCPVLRCAALPSLAPTPIPQFQGSCIIAYPACQVSWIKNLWVEILPKPLCNTIKMIYKYILCFKMAYDRIIIHVPAF